MSTTVQIACLVLAAGLSRRFGSDNKLLALWRDRPLISWTLDLAVSSEFSKAVVVRSGAHGPIDDLISGHDRLLTIDNPSPQEGMAGSLKLGVRALGAQDGVLVLLGDMPGIDVELISALMRAFTPKAYAVVPVIGDRIGNPVILGRQALNDVQHLSGDRGARALIKANWPDVVTVPVETESIFLDIDRPSDFSL